jgi:hypothetical protein
MNGHVSLQRCFNHQDREAVARCPICKRFFCRECVTEHDDVVACASCLRSIAAAKPARRVTAGILHAAAFALGFLMLWLSLYACGRALLRIPSSFHEGDLWQNTPTQQGLGKKMDGD